MAEHQLVDRPYKTQHHISLISQQDGGYCIGYEIYLCHKYVAAILAICKLHYSASFGNFYNNK